MLSELAHPQWQCDSKQAVAMAFGRAAASYDRHAEFQRQVADRLLAGLPDSLNGLKVLDLGCGTGYVTLALAERGAAVTAADLAPEMLAECQKRCAHHDAEYVVADAEQLPFATGEFDLVVSSLALQWCDDLSVPLREMRRVCRTGGQVFFSTLLDGSLIELKNAWNKIDSHQHVNEFISPKQVKLALAQSGARSHHIDSAAMTVWYPSALALMRDLKGIGANHVAGRSGGMMTRSALSGVEREYQKYENHQGLLPATYQVCFGVITA